MKPLAAVAFAGLLSVVHLAFHAVARAQTFDDAGVEGQSPDEEAPSCPRSRVDACPEATTLLRSLVEAQCLAEPQEYVEADALVEVLDGTCEVPIRIALRLDGQTAVLTLEEPERTRWRFVALAILAILTARADAVAAPSATEPSAEEPSVEEAREQALTPWVDPRPMATSADVDVWTPNARALVDTGRGTTTLALQLGVAGATGIVGLGAFSARHRFESPWTVGIEAHSALLGRLDGELLGALFGAVRGGYDAHYGSIELSLGAAPSRGLRPSVVAPTAGLRVRLGIEDSISMRAAFELTVSHGSVKVHRAMLRLQGLIFRRWRLWSQLDGFFASGIFSAYVGVDYWLVGRGEAGSWSIGGDFGTAFIRYVRQCEFGDCTAVGAGDESFAGPAAHLRLETRL